MLLHRPPLSVARVMLPWDPRRLVLVSMWKQHGINGHIVTVHIGLLRMAEVAGEIVGELTLVIVSFYFRKWLGTCSTTLGAAEDPPRSRSAHFGYNYEPPRTVPCPISFIIRGYRRRNWAKAGSLRSFPQDSEDDDDMAGVNLFDDVCVEVASDLNIDPALHQTLVDLGDWGMDGRIRAAVMLKLGLIHLETSEQIGLRIHYMRTLLFCN